MSNDNLKTKLELLITSESRLTKRLINLQSQIHRLERDIKLPELKKQFENKHFKYRNNYSCPSEQSDYWWMYIRIDKVIGMNEATGFSFQTDKYGKMEIDKDDLRLNLLGDPITKTEFDRAYKKFLSKLPKL